jgi:hypothetical protein
VSFSKTHWQIPEFLPLQQIYKESQYVADIETQLLQSLHFIGRWPIIVSEPTEKTNKIAKGRHSSYIVVTRYQDANFNQLEKQISRLNSSALFNPRGRFIVVIESQESLKPERDTAIIALQKLWQKNIINAVALVQQNDTVNIYTWYPYPHPRDELLDVCVSHSDRVWLLGKRNLFPEKIPRDMQRLTLRVSVVKYAPFVIIPESGNRTLDLYNIDGLEVRLLRAVVQKMNLSATVVFNNAFEAYGDRGDDGTWDGIMGEVLYNISDVAIGGVSPTNSPVDTSVTYFTERITFFVPFAEKFPAWLSFSRVFRASTWLCLLISVLLSGILMRCMASGHLDEYGRYGNIAQCLSCAWCTVIGVSVVEMLRSNSIRVFFTSWLAYSLAINLIFQIFVTSFLMDPGFYHQINSLEELKESDLKSLFESSYRGYLSRGTLKALEPYNLRDSLCMCMNSTLLGDDTAVLSSRMFPPSYAKDLGCAENIPMHAITDDLLHMQIVMFLQPGCPLLDSFNSIITQLLETGLINKFMDDIMDTLPSGKVSLSSDSSLDDYMAVSVFHLLSAFGLLFIGLSSSFIAFLMELIIYRARCCCYF